MVLCSFGFVVFVGKFGRQQSTVLFRSVRTGNPQFFPPPGGGLLLSVASPSARLRACLLRLESTSVEVGSPQPPRAEGCISRPAGPLVRAHRSAAGRHCIRKEDCRHVPAGPLRACPPRAASREYKSVAKRPPAGLHKDTNRGRISQLFGGFFRREPPAAPEKYKKGGRAAVFRSFLPIFVLACSFVCCTRQRERANG